MDGTCLKKLCKNSQYFQDLTEFIKRGKFSINSTWNLRSISWGNFLLLECLWHRSIIVCRWMNFMFSLQRDNPTCIPPKCGSLKMSNFDLYLMISGFGAIHVGLSHCIALTGYSWLTLVINSNNEVCSPLNNNVSKAFWN